MRITTTEDDYSLSTFLFDGRSARRGESVDVSREVPETWAKAMERKGFTHNGKPSISRLAGNTSLAVETVRRMVLAIGTPDQRSVNEVADALGVSRITVNQWMGIAREVEESYEPPADADLMGTEQRQAVDRIIQLLVEEKKQRGSGHGGLDTAATNSPPDQGGDSGNVVELPRPPKVDLTGLRGTARTTKKGTARQRGKPTDGSGPEESS